jgi:hypothetical protein
MREAAQLGDNLTAEGAINGIARCIIDEFPITARFAPSFGVALDAVQRAERKRRLKERKAN